MPAIGTRNENKHRRDGLSPVTLVLSLTAYLALLFWIARIGDRRPYFFAFKRILMWGRRV